MEGMKIKQYFLKFQDLIEAVYSKACILKKQNTLPYIRFVFI